MEMENKMKVEMCKIICSMIEGKCVHVCVGVGAWGGREREGERETENERKREIKEGQRDSIHCFL